MSRHRIEPHPMAEEAAQWLLELEDPQPNTLRDFAAWLETSPRHVEEFLLAAAVWKAFEHFDPARQLDIRQLIEDARNNVRPLPSPVADRSDRADGGQRRRKWRNPGVLIAAASVVIVAIATWLFHGATPQEYVTSRGELRSFKLDDGSVLYLNTKSRVEVSFSREARVVRLVEGEAMFTVEHDAARPFRVVAGPTLIQAIGTRFNVYRTPVGTTVSVVEGVVQISPRAASSADLEADGPAGSGTNDAPSPETPPKGRSARVSAGEQARVSPAGEVVTRTVPGLAQLVAWRERRLVFRGNSLDEVATEFNRYNSLQIRVEGDTARNKHITGVFSADDPRSLVLFLKRDASLSVAEHADEIVIHER